MDSKQGAHDGQLGPLAEDDSSRANTRAYAARLDKEDKIARFRNEFMIPTKGELGMGSDNGGDVDDGGEDEEREEEKVSACIYLCGNSLGLQPKRTKPLIEEELETWAKRGVFGHFKHPRSRPWVSIDESVVSHVAGIVGALASEVAVMGSLTANIHFLLAAFYRPTKERYKIIIESKAFPSDHYAVESQIRWHGFEPYGCDSNCDGPEKSDSAALVTISPEGNQSVLSTEQILRVIDHHADSAALLFLSGVQYYTGQAFDIERITKHAQAKGLVVGWDLAHAAGNIPLELHAWGVDFAAWCSYKYLCSGPGGIAGIFVHDKHDNDSHNDGSHHCQKRHRLAGWWGHDKATRFQMETAFNPLPGAAGYQLSNPSVLDIVALLGAVELFTLATPKALHKKSTRLTTYLWNLLHSHENFPRNRYFKVITPADARARGAQLSILFIKDGLMPRVFRELTKRGIVVDERHPDVIRVAPVPLYNTFSDVYDFVQNLRDILWMVEKDV